MEAWYRKIFSCWPLSLSLCFFVSLSFMPFLQSTQRPGQRLGPSDSTAGLSYSNSWWWHATQSIIYALFSFCVLLFIVKFLINSQQTGIRNNSSKLGPVGHSLPLKWGLAGHPGWPPPPLPAWLITHALKYMYLWGTYWNSAGFMKTVPSVCTLF